MAFLEADARPISAGWAPEPQLSAPNIGETLRAILANRLAQQEQTQKSISAAIKEMQTQRQTSAYTDALRNAGLTSGQDISGLSQQQATGLAQLIEQQTPDTEMDAYHKAAADKEQALADAIRNGTYGGRGLGGRSNPNLVTLTDADGNPIQDENGDPIRVDPRTKVGQQWLISQHPNLGPPSTSTQANTTVKPYGGLTPNDVVDQTRQKGFKLSPDGSKLVPADPGDSYEDDVTHVQIQPSTPGLPPVTLSKAEFERMKRQIIGPSYNPSPPNAEPPADNPDPVTPGTPGSVRVRPNASTGAPVNTPPPVKQPSTPGQQIDPATVQQYILNNNGDRDAARAQARADGWSF